MDGFVQMLTRRNDVVGGARKQRRGEAPRANPRAELLHAMEPVPDEISARWHMKYVQPDLPEHLDERYSVKTRVRVVAGLSLALWILTAAIFTFI